MLQALFDGQRQDFLYHFSLPTVVIYRPALRPLLLPVCLATDPGSPSFVTAELMGTVMDKLTAAVLLGDKPEEHRGLEVLHYYYYYYYYSYYYYCCYCYCYCYCYC